MRLLLKTFLGVSTVLASVSTYAQNISSAQTLRLAQSVYEQGRLHELPDLLKSVIANGSTEEKVSAYKLLTLASIYLEEPEAADDAMLNLLRTDPEFKYNEAIDPAEFVALYKTFRTSPIFRLGVKAGANASQPNVVGFFPSNDGSASYNYGLGFQVGATAEIPIGKQLVLNPELKFLQTGFKFENPYFIRNETQGRERMTWLNLSALGQYEFKRKSTAAKTVFYGSMGLGLDYLLAAENTLETRIEDLSPIELTSYDERELFRPLNPSIVLAGGTKLRAKKAVFVTEIRINVGLRTITNAENIYNNQYASFDNKFVHGIFSSNSLMLSVGYLVNRYNPKKLTNK